MWGVRGRGEIWPFCWIARKSRGISSYKKEVWGNRVWSYGFPNALEYSLISRNSNPSIENTKCEFVFFVLAWDELFIIAYRSIILLLLAFRLENASLVYRKRRLGDAKISELKPPDKKDDFLWNHPFFIYVWDFCEWGSNVLLCRMADVFFFLPLEGVEPVCLQFFRHAPRQLEASREAHQLGFDQQRVLCVQ